MIRSIAIIKNQTLKSKIEDYCAQINFLDLEYVFISFEDSILFLRNHEVDLIFIESKIADKSGFEFYSKYSSNIFAIFFGEDKIDAFEAFEINAIDFLNVEMEYKRFLQALNKARQAIMFKRQLLKFDKNFIHVRSEYKLIKIAFSEINYIETLDDYLKIYLLGKKPILTLMSMKSMVSKLPLDQFIRVHRSYIVPINRIESIRGKIINLGITEIPIGKSFEESFFQNYLRDVY